MARAVGIILSEKILGGLVVDHKLAGPLHCFPGDAQDLEDDGQDSPIGEGRSALIEMHTEALIDSICELAVKAADGVTDLAAIGVALPGLIRQGVVEEAPNLPQLKGARIEELLGNRLRDHNVHCPVNIHNDADGVAAGLASLHGKLDSMIRVWTLGVGIGYGRYPFAEGVWEGGHTVVTLDDKERFCGCGGRGHMEGIMGHRAMRLRFLDMEPEEVFEAANARTRPDPRCLEFKRLWHKALAAGTASAIHVGGAGKFFLTGFNARFIDLSMLKDYTQQMVKMSPLQSYTLEIVTDDPATRVIGSAVCAEHAANRC